MSKPVNFRLGFSNAILMNHGDVDYRTVVPFGLHGGGLITGHPIGALIVASIIFIAVARVPEFLAFFAAAIGLGGAIAFGFWLRRR